MIETLAYSDEEGKITHDITEAVKQEITYMSYQYVEKFGHKIPKKELERITARLYRAATKLELTYVRSDS